MLAVSTLLVTGLLLVMSLSVCRADTGEISSNDVSEIFAFIVITVGIFVSVMLLHVINARALQKIHLKK